MQSPPAVQVSARSAGHAMQFGRGRFDGAQCSTLRVPKQREPPSGMNSQQPPQVVRSHSQYGSPASQTQISPAPHCGRLPHAQVRSVGWHDGDERSGSHAMHAPASAVPAQLG
jgi:hypothetical protein